MNLVTSMKENVKGKTRLNGSHHQTTTRAVIENADASLDSSGGLRLTGEGSKVKSANSVYTPERVERNEFVGRDLVFAKESPERVERGKVVIGEDQDDPDITIPER